MGVQLKIQGRHGISSRESYHIMLIDTNMALTPSPHELSWAAFLRKKDMSCDAVPAARHLRLGIECHKNT